MRRSFLRQALVVLATCALFLPIALDYGVTAQAATFTFTDSNCTSFTFDGTNLTCQTGGGGGAFSCQNIVASPSSATVGNNIQLSVNCSGGTQPYTYAWSGGGTGCPTIGANGNPQVLNSGTAVSNCNYSVVANDSAASPSVNKGPAGVQWVAGGGGGGGGPINCSNVTGPTVTMDIPWPGDGTVHQYLTSGSGTFTPDGAVVIRFTTSGVANSTAGMSGIIKGVEYQGSPVGRTGSLSTQPCDFLGANALTLSGTGCGKSKFSNNQAPSEGLTQGTTVSKCAAALQSGTTYYFNLSNSGATCGSGVATCPMIIYFQKAGGT